MRMVLDNQELVVSEEKIAMVLKFFQEGFISIFVDVFFSYEFGIFSLVWYIRIIHAVDRKISSIGIMEKAVTSLDFSGMSIILISAFCPQWR